MKKFIAALITLLLLAAAAVAKNPPLPTGRLLWAICCPDAGKRG